MKTVRGRTPPSWTLLWRVLLVCLLCLCCWQRVATAAEPQPSVNEGKTFSILMVLWRGETKSEQGFADFFRQNHLPVRLTVFDCERDQGRLLKIRDQIRRERPDLIYTFGTTVTQALAGTIDDRDPAIHIVDIPIVFGVVADPVGARLVSDLGPAQRNITGVSHLPPVTTQLKTISDLFTQKRIGVVYDPTADNSRTQVAALEKNAPEYGLSIITEAIPLGPAGTPQAEAIPAAIARLASQQVELVYLPSDSFLLAHAELVTAEILRHNLPSYGAVEEFMRNGDAMLGLIGNYYSVGQFCAHKAEQILFDGQPPSALPVESLSRFSLVVNLATARRLGLYPPVDALMLAEVIKAEPHLESPR